MASETKKKHDNKKEPNLKGTLASVMFVLAFIVVSWFWVFGIFITR